MHRVDQEPRVVGEGGEAHAGVAVDLALGDVDVHADTEVAGQTGRSIQRLGAARECRVHADHASATGTQEPLVLFQAPTRAIGAVPVGDAVRADHPHPDFTARVRDDVERALDRIRRLVMIDDRGGAALERLERSEHRRPPDHLEVERDVEPPPDLLEDVDEPIRRRGRRGHAHARAPSTGGDARTRVRASSRSRVDHSSESADALRRIGRVDRHPPSRSCKAAATAPAVGTRPISPTPLMP